MAVESFFFSSVWLIENDFLSISRKGLFWNETAVWHIGSSKSYYYYHFYYFFVFVFYCPTSFDFITRSPDISINQRWMCATIFLYLSGSWLSVLHEGLQLNNTEYYVWCFRKELYAWFKHDIIFGIKCSSLKQKQNQIYV